MEEKRFCPNCGSRDVKPDDSNAAYIGESGGNPNAWKCNSCDYTGIMPEGDPDKEAYGEQNIRFDPGEEYPREDISFGKGYAKYLIYIALPATILYALYLILI